MKISPEAVSSFRMAKTFQYNDNIINSMDFSRDGELLITASDDETMILYDPVNGTFKRKLYSKKYGVDLVRFTHHTNTVICASKSGWDQSLRYLSLHDNRYLCYFKGHSDKVATLSMSPADDSFVSGSYDGTVRMWDLRTNICQGLLRMKDPNSANNMVGHSVATAFDPEGLVFAVAMGKNSIKLYDVRSFDKGPFSTFSVHHDKELKWKNMSFSNDGKFILLTAPGQGIIVIDSFTGTLVQRIMGYNNQSEYPLEASFSPDGQFILCGSEDGAVHVWESRTGKAVAKWTGANPHPGPVGRVLWNPKYMMVASACSSVGFWLPDI